MGLPYATLRKMPETQRDAIRKSAKAHLEGASEPGPRQPRLDADW
jgi:deoxyribodipyrimidine photolyase-like uncharacterized protein